MFAPCVPQAFLICRHPNSGGPYVLLHKNSIIPFTCLAGLIAIALDFLFSWAMADWDGAIGAYSTPAIAEPMLSTPLVTADQAPASVWLDITSFQK
jgi:hypothetical protein